MYIVELLIRHTLVYTTFVYINLSKSSFVVLSTEFNYAGFTLVSYNVKNRWLVLFTLFCPSQWASKLCGGTKRIELNSVFIYNLRTLAKLGLPPKRVN